MHYNINVDKSNILVVVTLYVIDVEPIMVV